MHLTGLFLALPLLSTAAVLEDRQLHRACFHKGSVALCCPESGDQLFAENCTTPSATNSALAFRASCQEEGLTAQCCETEQDGTGVVCAPVPKDPPS